MIRKLVAIVVSILINCAVLAWFHTWSTAAVAKVPPQPGTQNVWLLPTITVRPTPAQIKSLRSAATPPRTSSTTTPAGGGVQALVMPYYSFADESTAADAG